MEYKEDKFSTLSKGFTLGNELRILYLAPIIIIMIAITQNIDGIILMVSILLYYIIITALLILYFRHHEKKEIKEKLEMQRSTDKFYREFFRNKNKHNK